MMNENKPNMLVSWLKSSSVRIGLALAVAAASGYGAAYLQSGKSSLDYLRASILEKTFERIKQSPHYSVSTASEFKRETEKLFGLREKKMLAITYALDLAAAGNSNPQSTGRDDIEILDDEIAKAELVVKNHPLAKWAKTKTIFEEFVLKNSKGGAL